MIKLKRLVYAFKNLKNRLSLSDFDCEAYGEMYFVARRSIERNLFNYYATVYPEKEIEEWVKMTRDAISGLTRRKMLKMYLQNETTCEFA